MDADTVTNLGRDVLWTALKVAGPMLIVGLIVGLLFAVFQAVTSVNEQTMTLIPKMLAVMGTAILLLPWILRTLRDFTVTLLSDLGRFAG